MIRRYADDDSDQWLQAFATQERKTAVEVARDRTEPIQQQVRRALNPATPYTSVDEAVTAYRSMTGMDSLHQKRAAEQIRAVAVEEDAAEDPEKKKSPSQEYTSVCEYQYRCALIEKNPRIGEFVQNTISTNPYIAIPAVMHAIRENFPYDVTETEVEVPEMAHFINDLLKEETRTPAAEPSGIGKGVGTRDVALPAASENPFDGLLPARY